MMTFLNSIAAWWAVSFMLLRWFDMTRHVVLAYDPITRKIRHIFPKMIQFSMGYIAFFSLIVSGIFAGGDSLNIYKTTALALYAIVLGSTIVILTVGCCWYANQLLTTFKRTKNKAFHKKCMKVGCINHECERKTTYLVLLLLASMCFYLIHIVAVAIVSLNRLMNSNLFWSLSAIQDLVRFQIFFFFLLIVFIIDDHGQIMIFS